MAHPNITLKPFGGSEKENFKEFERLLRGVIAVTGIPNAQQANFLAVHINNDALRFFDTSLDDATRADFELSLTALRNHFCNPNLHELHKIKLESVRFDPKKSFARKFPSSIKGNGNSSISRPSSSSSNSSRLSTAGCR